MGMDERVGLGRVERGGETAAERFIGRVRGRGVRGEVECADVSYALVFVFDSAWLFELTIIPFCLGDCSVCVRCIVP